jgi:hypothetical protein
MIIFMPLIATKPMTTIYVLLENDQIRYIGKTRNSDLDEKLVQHLDEAATNPEKFGWLNNLNKEGKKPEIKPVFSFQDHEAEYYEKLFIRDYKFFAQLKLAGTHDFRFQSI